LNLPPLNRVLLVEDDPDILQIVEFALARVKKLSVETCRTGAEALERAERFAPDLILLDAMLPGMDGPSTLLELRKNPRLSAIPAVFMTAKIQPQDIAQYRELGALDVIPKPFQPSELAGTLFDLWSAHHEQHVAE